MFRGILSLRPLASLVQSAVPASTNKVSLRTAATYRGDDEKSKWLALNDKMYDPQKPGEERRPAFVCHEKKGIWYSWKRFYNVACFVRGMSVDEAIKQLNFVKIKGAKFVKEAILEAQEMAVRDHNVEFKSNLWVAESYVEKSPEDTLLAIRRHARMKRAKITLTHCNYYIRLEEGKPPKHYYYYSRPLSGQELLDKWEDNLRKRKVSNSL